VSKVESPPNDGASRDWVIWFWWGVAPVPTVRDAGRVGESVPVGMDLGTTLRGRGILCVRSGLSVWKSSSMSSAGGGVHSRETRGAGVARVVVFGADGIAASDVVCVDFLFGFLVVQA
jgi:hypothetical protein